MKNITVWITAAILCVVVAAPAGAQNKQNATDYYETQRVKDDIELNWGDGDDVKVFWDSAAGLLKWTDSADVLRMSFDPATGDIGQSGLPVTIKGTLHVDEAVTFDTTLTVTGTVTLNDPTNPTLNLVETAGSPFRIQDQSANTANIVKISASSASVINIDCDTEDGTSAVKVRLFRVQTNTSGDRAFEIYKGDGSTDITFKVDAATGDVVSVGNYALNGGGLTSTGDIEITPAGEDLFVDAVRLQLRNNVGATYFLRREDNTISSGNRLGSLEFTGDDAAADNTVGAAIKAFADGDWGPNDNPTRISFFVTLDGSGSDTLAGIIENDKELVWEAAIKFAEISTPTATTNYGAIYTKSNNGLYFQDGEGAEHIVHLPAFSDMWFHSASQDTTDLTNADEFYQFLGFENMVSEAPSGLVTASLANDEFTVASGGDGCYSVDGKISMDVSGTNQQVIIIIAVELNSPVDITVASNTSPIVITAAGHGLAEGDMVTISGVGGNTAANGDWLAETVIGDSFNLTDLGGTDSTGNGAYTSGGTIDIVYPGNTAIPRMFASTDLGAMPLGGKLELVAGDVVNLVFGNITSAGKTVSVSAVSLEIERIDADT